MNEKKRQQIKTSYGITFYLVFSTQKIIKHLFIILASEAGISVCHSDGEFLRPFNNSLPLLSWDSVSNLSAVLSVLHHQHFQFLKSGESTWSDYSHTHTWSGSILPNYICYGRTNFNKPVIISALVCTSTKHYKYYYTAKKYWLTLTLLTKTLRKPVGSMCLVRRAVP